MNGLKFSFFTFYLVALLSNFECSKEKNDLPPAQVKANAFAPSTPILKGMPDNPFLRIDIQVDPTSGEQPFRRIHCTLDANSVSEVQQIYAYLSGEAFSNTQLIGSVSPSSASFDIPVTANLTAGIHCIWLSVVLKDDVAATGKMELRAEKLIVASGKECSISQGIYSYAKYKGVVLRKAGDDNVNTYRIPGIVQTDRGTLLSVYDIRYNKSGDLPGNIDVGLSRSTDLGKTWEPMRVIMDMGPPHENNGIGDPSILFDPVTKKIWVAALWSKGNRSIAGSIGGISPDSTGQFVLVSSTDDGLTWSAPYTITPQIKDPAWKIFFSGPGNGISMQDGKLVFAAQYWNAANIPFSTIVYSNDHGDSWIGKLAGPKSNTTESQVVETVPGTLMLNMRDNRGGFRSVATTSSLGATWTEHATSFSSLPDPVCMGSFIKARMLVNGALKDVLFFSNPATSSGRKNITIRASLDLGETWQSSNQLLIDERTCYGYSSLTRIDENTIGILYEGVKNLYFVKLPVSDIIK